MARASTVGAVRRTLLLAVLAALAAVAPARAETLTLWGCHGPGGEPLPFAYDASATADAAISATGGGCTAAGGAVRIAFRRPDPERGTTASVRFATPSGVDLEHVWLGRRATGPGYWARTSSTPLETLATGSLDGNLFAAATGAWVEAGLRCETPDPRCDAPDAQVELRFAAVTVRDDRAPSLTADAVPRVTSGTFAVAVDARDGGIGVAGVSATLGGRTVATAAAGHGRCAELSPADATADLPLAEDCPPSDRLILSIDSTTVPDGLQRLELLVADGAGNTTAKGFDVRIVNTPPAAGPNNPPVTQGGVAIAPPPRPSTEPEIKLAARYKVARDGMFSISASCPAAAPATCAIKLKLTAKLPGRRRAATIASARSTAKPGKRARVNLRLSRAARSALKKKRTLRAQLTLEGAAPVSVKLAR